MSVPVGGETGDGFTSTDGTALGIMSDPGVDTGTDDDCLFATVGAAGGRLAGVALGEAMLLRGWGVADGVALHDIPCTWPG